MADYRVRSFGESGLWRCPMRLRSTGIVFLRAGAVSRERRSSEQERRLAVI